MCGIHWRHPRGDIKDDVEVISIVNESLSYSDKFIPSLPKDLIVIRGGRLSNGDLICEGYSDGYPDGYPVKVILEYWRHKDGSNEWENVGKRRDVETPMNSTFLIDNCFVSMDNLCSSSDTFSHHQLFANSITKKHKEHLYSFNYGHTAALFGQIERRSRRYQRY